MRIDVHQHLWTEPFVEALAARRELPFVIRESGLSVLHLAGERPYVIDLAGEAPASRAALVERDGLGRALICLSSPLGVEWLPRGDARSLIEAYLQGALALEGPFGVWAAIPLDQADPEDVDRALARGCVGLSIPAGALSGVDALGSLGPVLDRLEAADAPLFVHPGPARAAPPTAGEPALGDPPWWPALTSYVASMQAAWLAFFTAGRPRHPELRVIFSMLAGLAPLHLERLAARGGPDRTLGDPRIFYETSSYGPSAIGALENAVGASQLLYGSDRPVVEPPELGIADRPDWETVTETTRRALGPRVEALR